MPKQLQKRSKLIMLTAWLEAFLDRAVFSFWSFAIPISFNVFGTADELMCALILSKRSLSGGVTPCPHLRPSSGGEHTIIKLIQSGDDDYLMNDELGGNLTLGHYPTLKWYAIFYIPSRTNTAGHSKAFEYPVMVKKEGLQLKCRVKWNLVQDCHCSKMVTTMSVIVNLSIANEIRHKSKFHMSQTRISNQSDIIIREILKKNKTLNKIN